VCSQGKHRQGALCEKLRVEGTGLQNGRFGMIMIIIIIIVQKYE
jgi:hypothetical protein